MSDEEHNISGDELLDHASEQHQALSRRVMQAFDAEHERDSRFCIHCALTGVSIAKVAQLRYFIEIGTEHEREELQPFLDDALRERMQLGDHQVPKVNA